MIEVENIVYNAGNKRLLDGVSFLAKPGEFLTIIGANGAGKSTLLKLLCKEIQASSGSIRIRNQAISRYTTEALAQFRSVLAQQTTLSMSFQVEELVMMGRYPHFENRPSEKDRAIVEQAMQETGITEFKNRTYQTLSGGEQQRVQLARALAQIYDQPGGILFLDEPTNGLDMLYQQQIMQLSRDLADRGFCVISVLHDINFAARYADKVLILKQGKIISFGAPQQVITCENIHAAFNIRVRLLQDEEFQCPLVVPTMELSNKI